MHLTNEAFGNREEKKEEGTLQGYSTLAKPTRRS